MSSAPLKTAPPPTSAVLSMLAILALSLARLPSALTHIFEEAQSEAFTARLYPGAVSIPVLAAVRLLFGSLCWSVTVYSVCRTTAIVSPPYIRPSSRLLDADIEISGVRHLWPLTSWSWMVLGTHFLLSGAATARALPGWLRALALVFWKVAAPMTLLIGVVVKYVLWPEAVKKSGSDHILGRPVSLLQHNANIVMALAELLLLGGLPFDGGAGARVAWTYICLPMIYGIVYVFFSWATMTRWNCTTDDPKGEHRGPGAIYFFMDTTLGWRHTLILYGLLGVLLSFYGVFALVERHADRGEDPRRNLTMMIGLLMVTCRFRD